MPTILITGTSRGLGLGLSKAYLERGARVFAVTRRPPDNELLALWRQYGESLQPVVCDVGDKSAADQIERALKGVQLELALFNAGIYGPSHQDPQRASPGEIAQLFMSNAIAPVGLAQALQPHMQCNGTVAFMSSQMASVQLARATDMPLYGASKAALNSLLRSWSMAPDFPSLTLLALHPGWVRTELGGDDAPLSVEDSVRGLIDVMEAEAGQPGCRFLDHQGLVLPW